MAPKTASKGKAKAGPKSGQKSIVFSVDPNDLLSIWSYYKNIGKMLTNRGCEKETLTDLSFVEFREHAEERDMSIEPLIVENPRRKYLTSVTLYTLDKVDAKHILSHVEDLLLHDLPEGYTHNIIFVTKEKFVSKIKKIFAERPFFKEYGKINYETFDIAFFYDDKISNIMCVPMRELSSAEVQTIKERDRGFNPDFLPALLTSDPMCMYYGFPIGTVVEIKEDDEVFGHMTMHRVVTTLRGFNMRPIAPS